MQCYVFITGFYISASSQIGDLENEEEILEWLVDQLEKDEIEDVTDEMLDRLIKDGKTVAVLFCKYFTVFFHF